MCKIKQNYNSVAVKVGWSQSSSVHPFHWDQIKTLQFTIPDQWNSLVVVVVVCLFQTESIQMQ